MREHALVVNPYPLCLTEQKGVSGWPDQEDATDVFLFSLVLPF